MNSSASNARIPYKLNTKNGLEQFIKYIEKLQSPEENLSKFNTSKKQENFNLIKGKIIAFLKNS
jgi:hypothetical protein